MPFRARVKRALGGGSGSIHDNSSSSAPPPPKKPKKNNPQNVYRPGEKMPKPKYRGPWNQAHQDKLSAFSFGDAWKRRKSSNVTNKSVQANSEYSPMGSKMPSRGPSRRGSTWSAFSMKGGKRAWGMGSREHSAQDVHGHRMKSMAEDDGETGDKAVSSDGNPSDVQAPPPPPKDDALKLNGLHVANGNLQENTRPRGLDLRQTAMDHGPKDDGSSEPLATQPTNTNGELFTAEELATALSQSTLKASTG